MSQSEQITERRLESWKEISAYLQRDAKTAQRWEKEEGLPVHRHSHRSRATVYAYPSELDAWREGRKPDAEPEPERMALWGSPLSSFATAALLLLALISVGDPPPELFQANAQGMTTQMVTTGEFYVANSADGKFVTSIDWTTGGDVAVTDLETGTTRRVTHREPNTPEYADWPVISPDGRQVAYLNVSTAEPFTVRVVGVEEGAIPRTVLKSRSYVFSWGWSPDNKELLISRDLGDGTSQIAMLSLKDGSLRQLKSLPWAKIFARMSPDGRYIVYEAPQGSGPERDIFLLATDGSQEARLVQHPANDYEPVWSRDGSQVLFLSTRTATPSLWSIPTKDGKPAGEARLVKSDMGTAAHALGMTNDGSYYYNLRGRNRRNVLAIPLGDDGRASGPPEPAAETYFNANWGASLSPTGDRLAYYSNRPDPVLVVRDLESGAERVFRPEFAIVSNFYRGPDWSADGGAVLMIGQDNEKGRPRPFRLDLETGVADPMQSRNAGSMSSDGKHIYSQVDNSVRLLQTNLVSGEETTVFDLRSREGSWYAMSPAVSPDGRHLAFLQVQIIEEGKSNTSVMIKDLRGGEPRAIHQYPGKGGSGNFVNVLRWTPDQSYLLYVHDGWIWRVPATGGPAEQVAEVRGNGVVKAPQMSPDGSKIFFTSSEAQAAELWVLENFLPETSQ